MREKILQSFKNLGFVLEPLDDENSAYTYIYEGRKFIFFNSENDPEFIQLGIPAIIEISEEQRPFVNTWIQLLNLNMKYVKSYISEDGVWIFYERMLTDPEDTDEVLACMIVCLDNGINAFHSYVHASMADDDEDDEDEDDDDYGDGDADKDADDDADYADVLDLDYEDLDEGTEDDDDDTDESADNESADDEATDSAETDETDEKDTDDKSHT